jgi:AraC family transcriptional regulator
MVTKTKTILSHFHRSQIGRAQRFMRTHFSDDLTLSKISKEAGSSSFHFGRMFQAYTGETTFSFLRRIRISLSLRMLQEDLICSITEIALNVGYETPSAFNKAFKKLLNISPGDFRNLGKDEQDEVIYNLNKPQPLKEFIMDLTLKPDLITRPTTHFVFVQKNGPYAEVAIPTWMEMFPLIEGKFDKSHIKEFLGMSNMDVKGREDSAMIYDAGIALATEPKTVPKGLQYRKVSSGKYARFVLTGPYHEVWPAFEQVFRILGDSKIKLRVGECIENYLNDPNITPEKDLLTELLIPVE